MSVVRFELDARVAHIVLADAPHNVIGTRFASDFGEAVRRVSASDARALLIRSEGPHFSEGGDIAEFLTMDHDAWRPFITACHQAFRAVEALQIPTVSACRGRVFGGAFELALATDLLVASSTATFRNLEASVGSAPLAGGVQRLADRMGPALAARYTMLSEPMSGETAGRLGVAAFVVEDGEVDRIATELAVRLATGPTQSYRAIRTLLRSWSSGGVPAADSVLLDVVLPLHLTADARAGRAARVEALERGVEPDPVVFTGR